MRRPAPRRIQAVPARVAYCRVILGQCFPLRAAQTVEVINNLAVFYRYLALEFLIAVHARAVHIGKSEIAVLNA